MTRILLAVMVILFGAQPEPTTMPGDFQTPETTFWGNPGNVAPPMPIKVFHFLSCAQNQALIDNGWTQALNEARVALRAYPQLAGVVLHAPFNIWPVPETRGLQITLDQYTIMCDHADNEPDLALRAKYRTLVNPEAFRGIVNKIHKLPRDPEFNQPRDLRVIVYLGYPPAYMTEDHTYPRNYERALSIFSGIEVVLDGESYVDPDPDLQRDRSQRYQTARSFLHAHFSPWQASEALPEPGSPLVAYPSYAVSAVYRANPDTSHLTGAPLMRLWRGEAVSTPPDGPLLESVNWCAQDPDRRWLVMGIYPNMTPEDRTMLGGSHD